MPPKNKDEIDINLLPPMKHMTIGVRFECGKARANKLMALLKDCRSFQRNINREEIIAFCKEKNLYVDPNSLTDKQKKDSKFMAEVSTELTPDVMNKGFQLMVTDQVLAIRKAKYLKEQAAIAEKQAPPKKEDKKDAKKGKEAPPPPVEEVPKVPEKEYTKNFDLCFLVYGYPENAQEMVDLIILVKEKVINWGGVDMALLEQPEDFQEELEKRMEEFQQAPPIKKQLSEESVAFSQSEKAVIQNIRQSRLQSSRDSPLRNLTIKELLLEMDLEAEDETLKLFHEQLLEEICLFSVDQVQFAEWIQNKKVQPLITKEQPQDPFDVEVQKIKQEAQQAEDQQKLLEEQQFQEKNKKGAKKEAKKTEAELEAEKQAEAERQRQQEQRKAQIEAALEQQQKMKEKLHLQYYKKQLSQLDLNSISSGIMLEVLLDQLVAEQVFLKDGTIPPCLEDIEDNEQVNRILNNIQQKEKKQEFKQIILDECDYIGVRGYGCKLEDQQDVIEREHKIFDNIQFPGIDRYMMPEIAEKSDKVRKAIKSKLHPFINVDVTEFERRQMLLQYEECMRENEPEHEWYFGDRVYLERHNKNTLKQQFLQALLHDPIVITKYLPDDDSLMVICYYKNPPGRTLRKKWSAEWRVLPNLEYWINVRQFNSDFFYDIDYQKIGSLNERTKIMYPSDNSLILATKYYVGEKEYLRYRIIKENLIFGLNGSFYAEIPDIRMTVQLEDEKAIMNLTFKQGLCLRFTPSGDVVQSYLHQKQNPQQQQSNLLNLYDNAEINHDLEIKRIITGMGTVIIYKKDGSIIILYANGNTALYKGSWTTTNNKGIKKSQNNILQIPCAIKTDPETGAEVYIRDDQTMVIKYKDGTQYTQHYDGTIMFLKQDQVIVEHPNFATVKITIDRVKARTDTIIGMGSAYANVGFDNIFERSNDGRLVETFVDGTKIVSYLEKQELPEYKQYKSNRIHILYMSDGGVAKVVDDGEIVLVSSEERYRLNAKGEKKPFGKDSDFWLQLFSVADERKCGVYTVSLAKKCIFTKDEESNYFQIDEDGQIVQKISVSLNQEPSTPDQIPDGIFLDEENKFLPPPKEWVPPRIFLVSNDNTGVEYLNQPQLEGYFRMKEQNAFCTKIVDQLPFNCKSLSFITELRSNNIKFINALIPQTLDIVPKTIPKKIEVPKKIFTYRNFLEYIEFDKESRAAHEQCLQKYEVWQKSVLKTQSEFGVLQKSEEEKDAEFIIQMRILESRKTDYTTESYDQAKNRVTIPKEVEPEEILEQTIQKSARVQAVAQSAFLDVQKKVQSLQVQKSMRNREAEVKGFVTHYFETKEGGEFSRSVPPETFIVSMKPREKIQTVREEDLLQEEINNNNNNNNLENNNPQIEIQAMPPPAYNSLNQKPIIIKPSIFTQAEIDDEIKQRKILDDQYKYRQVKRKEFNVYGKDRKELSKVPCLLKTNPKSELNQKYILTDASTDNRIKISSMATRVYQQAPPISQVRNEGMHQTIIRTLDKKNNLEELIDKKNLMATGDLNDHLKKDLLIYPVSVRFGDLRERGSYEYKICVKNEDIMAQRIVIKHVGGHQNIKVFMKQMGSISLGLIRDVFINFEASLIGTFSDEFQIISKHQIYTIPINGTVLEANVFDKMNQEQIKLSSKPLLRRQVRDLKMIKKIDVNGDSQDSDLLPKIKYDNNFKIDPYQAQKKNEDISYEEES